VKRLITIKSLQKRTASKRIKEVNISGGQTGRFLEYRRAGFLKYTESRYNEAGAI
jgi:hypothetical protein